MDNRLCGHYKWLKGHVTLVQTYDTKKFMMIFRLYKLTSIV